MANQHSTYDYCVFFTKDFPFGIHENYIFNELPHLSRTFKKVLVIPHEEFNYKATENRLPKEYGNIELVEINHHLPALSAATRVKFVWYAALLLISEIITSRERAKHLRSFKALLGQLRHLTHAAYTLEKVLAQRGMTARNTVIYHYWFHRGMIISALLNKHFSHQKFRNVSRAHSLDLYHKDWNTIYRGEPLFLPFEQTRWQTVDQLYTITQHGYHHVTRVFPQYKSKVSIARLGVPDPGKPARTFNTGRKVIITCSLLNGNKRMFLLPDILRHVQCEVDWYHFGHGSDAAKEEIREKMKQCVADSKVHFMGLVPNTRIQAFYREQPIDLIVNLSEAEGLPVALMEAASFGVPMLATATVGNPEIVNNENGIVIPIQFDAQAVGTQVQALLSNEARWLSASHAARHTFETSFFADKTYAAFFQEIAQQPH